MKIAVIVGPFPKMSKTFIINEITGLLERGHDVTIISSTNPAEAKTHDSVSQYDLAEKTFYYQDHAPDSVSLKAAKIAPTLLKRASQSPGLVWNLLRRIPSEGAIETGRLVYWSLPFFDQEFDIIHAHFGPNGVLAAKLKQLGIPGKFVTTFHGYGINDYKNEATDVYRGVFDAADHLLGNSPYICEQMIEFGADETKVSLHPEAIDVDLFHCNPSTPDPTSETVTILTVARLAEEKGITHALSALRKLRDRTPEYAIEYRIVGHGPLETELKQQAKDAGLEEIVTFCGPMKRDGVIKEMSNSDLFVLPSLKEGLGVVLLEAQSSCVPVVGSSVGGIPKAIDPDNSGKLVPPGDPDAIADTVISLLEHPERWEEMGRHGRSYVEDNYDIDALNDELVELYRSLLE